MISAAPASVKRQLIVFAEFLLFIHKEHNTISRKKSRINYNKLVKLYERTK